MSDEGEEEEEFGNDGVQITRQSHSNLSGRDVVARFHVGTRVIRGPDWKWGDQVILYLSHSIYPNKDILKIAMYDDVSSYVEWPCSE